MIEAMKALYKTDIKYLFLISFFTCSLLCAGSGSVKSDAVDDDAATVFIRLVSDDPTSEKCKLSRGFDISSKHDLIEKDGVSWVVLTDPLNHKKYRVRVEKSSENEWKPLKKDGIRVVSDSGGGLYVAKKEGGIYKKYMDKDTSAFMSPYQPPKCTKSVKKKPQSTKNKVSGAAMRSPQPAKPAPVLPPAVKSPPTSTASSPVSEASAIVFTPEPPPLRARKKRLWTLFTWRQQYWIGAAFVWIWYQKCA